MDHLLQAYGEPEEDADVPLGPLHGPELAPLTPKKRSREQQSTRSPPGPIRGYISRKKRRGVTPRGEIHDPVPLHHCDDGCGWNSWDEQQWVFCHPAWPTSAWKEKMKQERHVESHGVRMPNLLPQEMKRSWHQAHRGGVSGMTWSPGDGSFLLTGGCDGAIRLWDALHYLEDSGRPSAPVAKWSWVSDSGDAVRELAWNERAVAVASWDHTIRLFDPSQGKIFQTIELEGTGSTTTWHPTDPSILLTGDSSSNIQTWDLRCPETTRGQAVGYFRGLMGRILSTTFLSTAGALQIVASSDCTRKNASSKSLAVWDYESGACISGNLYNEGYTCPRLLPHPTSPQFLAESNADYIVAFSSSHPWEELHRFRGHSSSGFRVGLDVSPDGQFVGCGSNSGQIYLYQWKNNRLCKHIPCGDGKVVQELMWHPVLPSLMAFGTSGGRVGFLQ